MSKPAHLLIQLYYARTFGEFYQLPFPHKIAPIQDTKTFADFSERFYSSMGSDPVPPAFVEADKLANDFDDEAEWHTPQERRAVLSCLKNDTVDTNHILHFDSHEFRKRFYFAASRQAVSVVSHADTLEILANDFQARQILSKDMTEETVDEFKRHIDRLSYRFEKAARPVEDNTVYVITGGTLHFRPAYATEGRVFYRGQSFIPYC